MSEQDVGWFVEKLTHKVIRTHTGVSKSAPGNWKFDGGIPPRYYPIFKDMCAAARIRCERKFFFFAKPVVPVVLPEERPGP